MNSASLDQDEPIWDEESYLSDPFPMNCDEWYSLKGAPCPDDEYFGGDEVWVLESDDIVNWGNATGQYMWTGHGFKVEVAFSDPKDDDWFDEDKVWRCTEEDVE